MKFVALGEIWESEIGRVEGGLNRNQAEKGGRTLAVYPPCALAQTFVIMTRLAFDINREAAVGVLLGHKLPLASLIIVI